MELNKIHSFLRKNNFIKNNRDGSFSKTINNVKKRYRFKDFGIYMEVKRNSEEDFELFAFGDIRRVFINEKGQLSGLKKALPSYSADKIKDMDA